MQQSLSRQCGLWLPLWPSTWDSPRLLLSGIAHAMLQPAVALALVKHTQLLVGLLLVWLQLPGCCLDPVASSISSSCSCCVAPSHSTPASLHGALVPPPNYLPPTSLCQKLGMLATAGVRPADTGCLGLGLAPCGATWGQPWAG